MEQRVVRVEKNIKHIEQLTWLRGIAAFFIIITHTLRATEVKYGDFDHISDNAFLNAFGMGSFGVVLFFVLSGCTLYLSNSNKVGLDGVGKFYLKRFFRIWPAFFVSLVFYIGFGYLFGRYYIEPQGYWVEAQFLTPYSTTDIFSYLSLVFNITGPEGLFNNAYWSLPVEFQYYLIFPLIIGLLRVFGVAGPIVLSIILFILPRFGFVSFDDNVVFTLAFSFCGGVLIGYGYMKLKLRINSLHAIVFLCLFFFMTSFISSLTSYFSHLPILSNRWNWYGIISLMIVFVVLFTDINIHNKAASFMKFYGSISYSTYLYHNLFIATGVLLIINFEIYDEQIRIWFILLFTLITSYIAAALSYKYVEEPAITLGRSVTSGKQRVERTI